MCCAQQDSVISYLSPAAAGSFLVALVCKAGESAAFPSHPLSIVMVIFACPMMIFTVVTEHPGHRVFCNHPRTYDQILAIKVSKGPQAEADLLGLGVGSTELSLAEIWGTGNMNVEG